MDDDLDEFPEEFDPRVSGRVPARFGPGPAAVAARRRARVLSILLAATVISWTLVPLAQVTVSAAMPATLLLLADLAALSVAGRRRAVRRAVLDRERRLAEARRRQQRRADAPPPVARPAAPVEPVPVRPEYVPRATPSAGLRPERASERVARELDGTGSSWVPVPVPPPTYTFKPMAPRPEPATAGLPGSVPPRPEITPDTSDAGPVADQPSTSEALAAAEAPAGEQPPAAAGPTPEGEERQPAARTPRPWEDGRTFADDLDLDAVLARRRAVNG